MTMQPARRRDSPQDADDALRRFFAARGADVDAQAIVFSLFGAQARVFSMMEGAALRPLGLTHAGFVTLMLLWTQGPLETRELARVLGVSRPAVVSSVNTLERARLVRRRRSQADRRLVTVELTARGQDLVERAQRETHTYERLLAAQFTKDEQRALASLLRRLGETAGRTAQSSMRVIPRD
jgi:DNA-binding MarR family transcriptional regulator